MPLSTRRVQRKRARQRTKKNSHEKTENEEVKEKTPRKPKAKAKSKAKAKAKGKPKAASTRQKQKEKKETKDTKEKNEEEDAPKRENLNDKCEKWRAAVGDAETQQDQQDVSEEEGELRDRGKARKFQKLKDAGPIPDHILAMFEHESQRSKTSQDHIRLHLLTGFFKSDGKGGHESSVLASQFLNPKTHLVLQARGQHECAQDFGTIMLQRD